MPKKEDEVNSNNKLVLEKNGAAKNGLTVSRAEIIHFIEARADALELIHGLNRGQLISDRGFEFHKESNEEFLDRQFEEVDPMEFYNTLYRSYDYLGTKEDYKKRTKGTYSTFVCEVEKDDQKRIDEAVANEKKKKKKEKNTLTGKAEDDEKLAWVKTTVVTQGLEELEEVIKNSDHFCLTYNFSYCSWRPVQKNAHLCFALAIDLDALRRVDDEPTGLRYLVAKIMAYDIPTPTYIVDSGTGLHLYYIFKNPIPCFPNNVAVLKEIRNRIIGLIWDQTITDDYKDVQYENLWQAFRAVGTKTKVPGKRVKAYRFGDGELVDLNYLAVFAALADVSYKDENGKKKMTWTCKSNKTREEILYTVNKILKACVLPRHSYAEVKEMWPEWTEKHFDENGKPIKNPKKGPGGWVSNPKLYEWWLKKLPDEARVGHRYHCLLTLAAFAKKCDIPKEKFADDCWKLFESFSMKDVYDPKDNKQALIWKKKDVEAAIASWDKVYLRNFSREGISNYSGILIPYDEKRHKRNYQKRWVHLQGEVWHIRDKKTGKVEISANICKAQREVKYRVAVEEGRVGRKDKRAIIQEWRKNNPTGKKADCIRETGLTKPTVYKWWGDDIVK